ncbi:MAG: hypothetical protein EXR78_00460 [Deltaproteobacteria bacterium]|nr:hypothetical protein [Deltaproteobacteria bacterium]
MTENQNKTVGIPGTEERLALADVEERLRQVRGRWNFHTVQHHLYRLGAVLALGTALLIVCTFVLSPMLFTLLSWPVLLLLAFCFLFFVRRGVEDWADLNTIARRVDARAGLKERLATLVAQLTGGAIGKPPPSSLWPHLLAENTRLLNDWEVKRVSPSRIPWSAVPFLLALLLTFFIASIPMLSERSTQEPFSLANLETVLGDLPNRAGELLDRKLSLLPDTPKQWGGGTLFDTPRDQEKKAQDALEAGNAENQRNPESPDKLDAQSLASLPQALQEKIRQALQGLPDKAPKPPTPEGQSAEQDPRLALQAREEQKTPSASMDGQGDRQGEQSPSTSRNRDDKKKDGSASGKNPGAAMSAPSQGSGLQQLEHAQLERKNAKGTFQPDSPQVPGSGGESGEGGPGAGSGTEPRLYGEEKITGKGGQTFQLALETTHKKSQEGELDPEEKDTGGIIEKSTKGLSREQSLDDAIRKSQVPAEYEDIVKRLFVRGESR